MNAWCRLDVHAWRSAIRRRKGASHGAIRFSTMTAALCCGFGRTINSSPTYPICVTKPNGGNWANDLAWYCMRGLRPKSPKTITTAWAMVVGKCGHQKFFCVSWCAPTKRVTVLKISFRQFVMIFHPWCASKHSLDHSTIVRLPSHTLNFFRTLFLSLREKIFTPIEVSQRRLPWQLLFILFLSGMRESWDMLV